MVEPQVVFVIGSVVRSRCFGVSFSSHAIEEKLERMSDIDQEVGIAVNYRDSQRRGTGKAVRYVVLLL